MASGAPTCRGRRVAVMLVFLVLSFHVAVCVAASPAMVSRKASLSGRKGGLASAEKRKPDKVVGVVAVNVVRGLKKTVAAAMDNNQIGELKQGKKLTSGDVTTGKFATTKTLAAAAAVKTKLLKDDKAVKHTKLAKIGTKKSPEYMAKTKKPSDSNAVDVMKPEEFGKQAQPVAVMTTRKSAEAVAATLAEEDGAEDLISEFRELPARLQETLVPDLARLSSTSRAYLSAANAGIADGVRPLLGGRWAPVAATVASAAVLLLPLCLLAALVRRVGAYLPLLRRALLLAQAYLAIYFGTLAVAAAATGLEPLRFFHAASPAAYAWTQAAQSLGYVAYLVLQMVDLVAAFSSHESSAAGAGEEASSRALSMAQMLVGLAVGLHYYAAVFHRATAGEAPRATWRVHAVYAACFMVVCACARAERRKKAYLAGSAEAWKKS
ncbi:hypothetical protein E2562_020345 [Oryza meyeriana var. granulata]|uniref:Uncharacterized protein n=1 Tax=Oryza meyeriana var. granulata TaxID=110450 RepID=A0A6G1DL71_9ORYZ|nr:hypothetical protein E2562_020345 [Oryza meyeriana var. granulata]